MKQLILCVFMFLLSAVSLQARETYKNGNSKVEIIGNKFVVAGKPLRLTGVSMSDPDKLERAGHWNKKYFRLAKSWGCNAVRLPIHTYTWRYRGAENYLSLLDKGVKWAGELGMYVILDWHAIGNMVEDSWPGFNYMTNWDETFKFWMTMAEHYKGNTTVAVFELFNEPEAEKRSLTWEAWKLRMEEVVDSIRKIDNERICAVAGMNWAYELDKVIENPVRRDGIAYITHPYPMKREAPWEDKWESDFGHVAQKYPVIATELGYVVKGQRGEHVPCIGDETYGREIMDFMRERGISYTIWAFDPDWAPALLENYDGKPTPRQGVFFRDAIRKDNNIKK